jgi:DNA-binding CsgD family transcriptional regulator
LADDGSIAATYRHGTITNQRNQSNQKKSRRTVSLTAAERSVLTLLTRYRTLSAIGSQLGIGRPTVKTHVQNTYGLQAPAVRPARA